MWVKISLSVLVIIMNTQRFCHSKRLTRSLCSDDVKNGKECPSEKYFDVGTKCCQSCWDICSDGRNLKDECQKHCPKYLDKLQRISTTTHPTVISSQENIGQKHAELQQISEIQTLNNMNNEHWHIALEVTLVVALMVVIGLLLLAFKSYRNLEKKFKEKFKQANFVEYRTGEISVKPEEDKLIQGSSDNLSNDKDSLEQAKEDETVQKCILSDIT